MVRLLGLWGPVAAWMALIFSISSAPLPGDVQRIPDWATHVGAYAVLAMLACRAFAGGWRPGPARVLVLGAALAAVYGVTDEWHQSFIAGRFAEARDLAMDVLGAVAGAWVFRRLVPRGLPQPEGVR